MVLPHLRGLPCSAITITIITIILQLVHLASIRVSPPRSRHMLTALLWRIMRSIMACQWIYMYLKVFRIIGELEMIFLNSEAYVSEREREPPTSAARTRTKANVCCYYDSILAFSYRRAGARFRLTHRLSLLLAAPRSLSLSSPLSVRWRVYVVARCRTIQAIQIRVSHAKLMEYAHSSFTCNIF